MTEIDEHHLRRCFADKALNVTPTALREFATIRYLPRFTDSVMIQSCESVISRAERERAHRFHHRADRDLFVQRRAFRRYCAAAALESSRTLSQFDFDRTATGRPFLTCSPGVRFSFASCQNGLLAAWSHNHWIGVDIEAPPQNLEVEALSRHFYSVAEAETIDRADARSRISLFLHLWTLKESACKTVGAGLTLDLDAFQFSFHPAPRIRAVPAQFGAPRDFEGFLLDGTGSTAAVVIRRPI